MKKKWPEQINQDYSANLPTLMQSAKMISLTYAPNNENKLLGAHALSQT